MTFEQRCTIAQQCLPDAEYRARLTALHNEMLARIAELEVASGHEKLGRVGSSKLADLLKDGVVVDGVAIARTSDDGEVTRGAVTAGGMVLWRHGAVVAS